MGPARAGVPGDHVPDRRVGGGSLAQLGPAQPRQPVVGLDPLGVVLDRAGEPLLGPRRTGPAPRSHWPSRSSSSARSAAVVPAGTPRATRPADPARRRGGPAPSPGRRIAASGPGRLRHGGAPAHGPGTRARASSDWHPGGRPAGRTTPRRARRPGGGSGNRPAPPPPSTARSPASAPRRGPAASRVPPHLNAVDQVHAPAEQGQARSQDRQETELSLRIFAACSVESRQGPSSHPCFPDPDGNTWMPDTARCSRADFPAGGLHGLASDSPNVAIRFQVPSGNPIIAAGPPRAGCDLGAWAGALGPLAV